MLNNVFSFNQGKENIYPRQIRKNIQLLFSIYTTLYKEKKDLSLKEMSELDNIIKNQTITDDNEIKDNYFNATKINHFLNYSQDDTFIIIKSNLTNFLIIQNR